jgi:predicted unusual protein kinase regulating ubiquinone biosynthesis (AarF/ABC1/UbiB family)
MKTLKIGIGFEMTRLVTMNNKKTAGIWLRKTLEESGPTYIKIGQFIGNRSDLFGKDISEELSKLQNQTKTTFRASKPNGVYKMDDEPIASASIAQVHLGKLEDGRLVAIKIKRPHVDYNLKNELKGIRDTIRLSKVFMSEMSLLSDWFDDFEKTVADELDFSKEVSNIELFSNIYKYNQNVRVPRVIPELSGKDHIVMEYIPSDPIKKCKNPMTVSENLMNTFIEQILYNGVIHGDLHAGNLGVRGDDDQLVMYDFGNIIRIPDFYKKAMRDVLVASQERNSNGLLKAMSDMGMVIKDISAAENFTSKFFVYLDTLDPKSFTYTQDDIMVPIELDTITLTILRTSSLVEGICKEIYPQFTYEQVIQQNIELLAIEQFISAISQRTRQYLDSQSQAQVIRVPPSEK